MTKVYIYQVFLKSPSGGDDVIYKSRHLHKINEVINKYTQDNNIKDVSGIPRLSNLLRFNKYYPKYMTKITQTPMRDYYKDKYTEKFNMTPDETPKTCTSRYRIYNIYKDDDEMMNDDEKPTRKNIYLSRRKNVISDKMKENKLYPDTEIQTICKDVLNDIINVIESDNEPPQIHQDSDKLNISKL